MQQAPCSPISFCRVDTGAESLGSLPRRNTSLGKAGVVVQGEDGVWAQGRPDPGPGPPSAHFEDVPASRGLSALGGWDRRNSFQTPHLTEY